MQIACKASLDINEWHLEGHHMHVSPQDEGLEEVAGLMRPLQSFQFLGTQIVDTAPHQAILCMQYCPSVVRCVRLLASINCRDDTSCSVLYSINNCSQ